MSKETPKIAAQTRTVFGDNASRRLRKAGTIPAVVYSKGAEPKSIQISADEWKVVSAQKSRVVMLVEDGKETAALVREVQFNYLKNYVVHVDFQQIDLAQEMTVKVAVASFGDCVGVTRGGVLKQEIAQLELTGSPVALPDVIKVDVSGLDKGQAIAVKDLTLPEGVRAGADAEAIVFQVSDGE